MLSEITIPNPEQACMAYADAERALFPIQIYQALRTALATPCHTSIDDLLQRLQHDVS